MTITQEEIFGPVLAVIPYHDEKDAIRMANDSVYGLAGNPVRLSTRSPWRTGYAPGSSGSTAARATGPIHRSAATRPAASAARTVSPGFDQYTQIESAGYPAT